MPSAAARQSSHCCLSSISSSRSRIPVRIDCLRSSAARSVNVVTTICSGSRRAVSGSVICLISAGRRYSLSPSSTLAASVSGPSRCARRMVRYRSVSVVVFPVPAPASTVIFLSSVRAAVCCSGSRVNDSSAFSLICTPLRCWKIVWNIPLFEVTTYLVPSVVANIARITILAVLTACCFGV